MIQQLWELVWLLFGVLASISCIARAVESIINGR